MVCGGANLGGCYDDVMMTPPCGNQSIRHFGDPSRFVLIGLHSVLSSSAQRVAFDTPPSGIRKIVVATNIAETGITIPDVVYVIDSGRVKETGFDERRGM